MNINHVLYVSIMHMNVGLFTIAYIGHDFGPHRLQHGERGGGCDERPGRTGEGRGQSEEGHVRTVHHAARAAHHYHARGSHLEALAFQVIILFSSSQTLIIINVVKEP